MPQDTTQSLQRDIDEYDLSDDDALFKALEEEDDSGYRAHRIEQLNAEFATAQKPHNQRTTLVEDSLYPTLKSDQALLDYTTQTQRCVIHFAHPDFARCTTMDEHIRALAARHQDVRFARVDVRETPFVVEKLKIRVLPCVIGFLDGVAAERVLGFEGLGPGGSAGLEGFNTASLEKRLLAPGILSQARFNADDVEGSDKDNDEEEDGDDRKGRRSIRTGTTRAFKEDDDDDWD
ncbi:thioredoxin domain-containing protein [Aspergillus mulundensis]|uniref:Phosducin-like protein n=1 Tax=Aspergillus mulundensis TaxID=1810919 RepID=A0A3D8QJF1_9EURO|nr:Phosducin-like protein [Aspergillus mulundensis]RDW61909.1 Phosducin-like protein [Aspergillus mulundensis]